ncbi:hypothetical protein BEL04_22365 [Mucilaginibacter sp. PPCGB 2223]|uniref:hypothetical protein n=1 Tax=Mucilaginibacter sp. PPCGB 2223 TaxID=1886027 RepID=UPI000826E8C8|nr:hypothetical protein [Mucilaginibacter sp. PPCGB 2223]OCX50524.1 hypothetical protein BEL04_22365 [Mucilaginibacter sp. PPCGB 2223]
MKTLQIIVILIAAAIGLNAEAQTTTADSTHTKSLFFNAGLQYISNLTYAGRRDNSSVPILLPMFTVVSKQGLFVSAAGYFDLNGSKSGAEGLSVTPGYVFSFDQKKEFGGALSATKYFITNSSPIILSSFNATIDGQLNYNPANIVKITVGGSYRFAKQNSNDIVNNVELSKEIGIMKTGAKKTGGLKIAPAATLYTGTQSFYETYYTTSQVQRAIENPGSPGSAPILGIPGTGTPGTPPSQTIINETDTQQKQQQVKQYTVLAASATMPITYTIDKVQLTLTPYFIKPFNQVDYTSNTSTNGLYFLFTGGVSVTF